MSSEIDPAYIASLAPSFFTKNVSAPLLHVSIVMAVLQTLFIMLFFTSRILNKLPMALISGFLFPLHPYLVWDIVSTAYVSYPTSFPPHLHAIVVC